MIIMGTIDYKWDGKKTKQKQLYTLTLADRFREAAVFSGELPTSSLAKCGCNLAFCFIFQEDKWDYFCREIPSSVLSYGS